jgi:hypothetical protein
MPIYYDMDLFVFTKTTNVNNFSSEVINVSEANILVSPSWYVFF